MKVKLHFELQDSKGASIKSYWKEIDMPAAPTEGMTFDDNDFTFTPNRGIMYSLADSSFYLRHVVYAHGEDVEEYAKTLNELGWVLALGFLLGAACL